MCSPCARRWLSLNAEFDKTGRAQGEQRESILNDFVRKGRAGRAGRAIRAREAFCSWCTSRRGVIRWLLSFTPGGLSKGL